MRAEFFGGPLDGDLADFLGEMPPEEITIPLDAKTNRYMEAMAVRTTPIVHIYRRGKTGPNGIVRLEYDGYGKIEEAAVGG